MKNIKGSNLDAELFAEDMICSLEPILFMLGSILIRTLRINSRLTLQLTLLLLVISLWRLMKKQLCFQGMKTCHGQAKSNNKIKDGIKEEEEMVVGEMKEEMMVGEMKEETMVGDDLKQISRFIKI